MLADKLRSLSFVVGPNDVTKRPIVEPSEALIIDEDSAFGIVVIAEPSKYINLLGGSVEFANGRAVDLTATLRRFVGVHCVGGKDDVSADFR